MLRVVRSGAAVWRRPPTRPLARFGRASSGVARPSLATEEEARGAEGGAVATTHDPATLARLLRPLDSFPRRHIGPRDSDVRAMLATLGLPDVRTLIERAIPAEIRSTEPMGIGPGLGEVAVLQRLRRIMSRNALMRNYIGLGYHGTVTPPVIQRNVLEHPGWYTQYTPYQPEISQGRLESLLNFQTMVTDLTGLPVANASLLDEATAAAEAMLLCYNVAGRSRTTFFVDAACHPQTIACVRMRAEALPGVRVVVGDHATFDVEAHAETLFGVLLQYPTSDGRVVAYEGFATRVHAVKAMVACATDLMALTLLRPPGEWGADVAVGSSQRFGVPMGCGGPHAAFFAVAAAHQRRMPGRLVGVSRDTQGRRALRLSLQTREQHIRREKATSNICTAQALLANMAAMYAVYHGPRGLRDIALRIHGVCAVLADALEELGHRVVNRAAFFDTLTVQPCFESDLVLLAAQEAKFNLRRVDATTLGISLDETVTEQDLRELLHVFVPPSSHRSAVVRDTRKHTNGLPGLEEGVPVRLRVPKALVRTSAYLQHPVFNTHHSETEMLRYLTHLQSKDLSLADAMIPLGSCTMKLNATTQMLPVTWPTVGRIHPFAPADQMEGYHMLCRELEWALARITGLDAVSLQPNSGAQGEYAGLRVILAYLASKGQGHRKVCLIPVSAHGTNPASAAMAGMEVVPVACDAQGNLDRADLTAKIARHRDRLAAIMITYPSTFGVFEPGVQDMCREVHDAGAQVYLDGANMNAQVGLCSPGSVGADVCHLNLHKTFCIPHGGGGPGVGPIAVRAHLEPFLPGHPLQAEHRASAIGPISAAPYGSASILPISWAYIHMMGDAGLTRATELAILNANYMAARLAPHYKILYRNEHGLCAHEFILDTRPYAKSAGVDTIDIAKRLQDYGFHSPTMSWPVTNTLMVEPTESEPRAELDRFCDALIAIRGEIRAVEEGRQPRDSNVLKHAPHVTQDLVRHPWDRPYTRDQAAYPLPWLRDRKFWPSVSRISDAYGDKNLMCTCPPIEAYLEDPPSSPK